MNETEVQWAVLGFTARDASRATTERIWTPEVRMKHLLNEEIALPISIDARVCRDALGLDAFRSEGGDWVINPAGLVVDEARFKGFLEKAGASDDRIELAVAAPLEYVTALSERRGFPDDPEESMLSRDLNGADWRLLGYDCVNFNGAVSGLFNCGFKDKKALAAQFKGGLNEHGLFVDPKSAAAFSNIQDRDVPSHAPFTAAAVYLSGTLPRWASEGR